MVETEAAAAQMDLQSALGRTQSARLAADDIVLPSGTLVVLSVHKESN